MFRVSALQGQQEHKVFRAYSHVAACLPIRINSIAHSDEFCCSSFFTPLPIVFYAVAHRFSRRCPSFFTPLPIVFSRRQRWLPLPAINAASAQGFMTTPRLRLPSILITMGCSKRTWRKKSVSSTAGCAFRNASSNQPSPLKGLIVK